MIKCFSYFIDLLLHSVVPFALPRLAFIFKQGSKNIPKTTKIVIFTNAHSNKPCFDYYQPDTLKIIDMPNIVFVTYYITGFASLRTPFPKLKPGRKP